MEKQKGLAGCHMQLEKGSLPEVFGLEVNGIHGKGYDYYLGPTSWACNRVLSQTHVQKCPHAWFHNLQSPSSILANF